MARKEKIVIQSRIGEQSIDRSKIIYFPKGIIGFEDKHEFVLLQVRKGAPLLILQSIDDPQLGLLVADPYSFLPNYTVKVGDAEQAMLCLQNSAEASVLVTVSIPQGKPHLTSLNLTGPILVHSQRMIGLQVPQADANPPHILLESLVPTPMPKPASEPINLENNQKEDTMAEGKCCKEKPVQNSTQENDAPLTPCNCSTTPNSTPTSCCCQNQPENPIPETPTEPTSEKPKRKCCKKKKVEE